MTEVLPFPPAFTDVHYHLDVSCASTFRHLPELLSPPPLFAFRSAISPPIVLNKHETAAILFRCISPGRTVGIALLLLLLSAVFASFPGSSGTVNIVEIGIKIFSMPVILTPLLVPIIAFHFWLCYRSPLAGICKPGMRRVLMLFPFGCLFLVTLIHAIQHWPTPAIYFERYFKQAFPTAAVNVSVRPSTLADPGHVGFSFEAGEAEIRDLIARLRLDELKAEADFGMTFNISGRVNPSAEAGFEFWERSDNRGTGYLLAHHPQSGEVFVARNPGWAKSDEDLGHTTSRFRPDE